MYIYSHLFYDILNIFEYISKYYVIPYYKNVICTACYPFSKLYKEGLMMAN